MTIAISMMRSVSGCKPVISMSSQIRLCSLLTDLAVAWVVIGTAEKGSWGSGRGGGGREQLIILAYPSQGSCRCSPLSSSPRWC
ncbi:hypothetical protein D9M70_570900 [compost metagenome]